MEEDEDDFYAPAEPEELTNGSTDKPKAARNGEASNDESDNDDRMDESLEEGEEEGSDEDSSGSVRALENDFLYSVLTCGEL